MWIEGTWRVRFGVRDDGLEVVGEVRQRKESNNFPTVSTDGVRALATGIVQSELFLRVSLVGHQRRGVWDTVRSD